MTNEATTTVSCRLTWRKRDQLHTLALANSCTKNDLLVKLVDSALAETGVDLQAPQPEPEDPTPALLEGLTGQVSQLQEQVGNLTALVQELTAKAAAPAAPAAPTALTLNVPQLAAVGQLAQNQLNAQQEQQNQVQLRLDAERLERERPRVLRALAKLQRGDSQLHVSEPGYDGKVWVWKKGLGNGQRRDQWLTQLERSCDCDPRPHLEVTPDACKLPRLRVQPEQKQLPPRQPELPPTTQTVLAEWVR